MSQAISISSTRLINFNYDFANCCVTIATMTIKQDLRTCTNKFLNCAFWNCCNTTFHLPRKALHQQYISNLLEWSSSGLSSLTPLCFPACCLSGRVALDEAWWQCRRTFRQLRARNSPSGFCRKARRKNHRQSAASRALIWRAARSWSCRLRLCSRRSIRSCRRCRSCLQKTRSKYIEIMNFVCN